MTQPPLLNYQTPTDPRLADINPRWLRCIITSAILIALAQAISLLYWIPTFSSNTAISILIGITSYFLLLVSALFLIQRPPVKLAFTGIQPAILLSSAAAFLLMLPFDWILWTCFRRPGLNAPPSPPWWFVTLVNIEALVTAPAWFFRFLYFAAILRLAPAPRIALQATLLALALLVVSLFQCVVPFLSRSGNASIETLVAIWMYSYLAITLWAMTILILTTIKLAHLLPRPS